ncbi:MAG: hypothetical protein KUG77_21990 [Nannocystaceae bacterium]|nr:hypothetical protein [Nannocystaceae bacterium]
MLSLHASILRFSLLSLLASVGCTSSPSSSPSSSSSGGTGGKGMPQTMFHPSCEEPQTSTAVTCDNLCSKLALCTAGLCAEQTTTVDLCDGSVAAELKASCLSTCDEDVLEENAEDVQCLFENTCASVFIQQDCGPENSVECGDLPTPSGTSNGGSGQPTTCPYEFDGECDEPEGTGLCPQGSDPADCSGVSTTGANTDGWGSTGSWETSSSGSTGWYGSSGSSGSTGGSSTSF